MAYFGMERLKNMDYSSFAPQIIQTEIDGQAATCIVLGDASTHLPGYLLHGKSQTSYAYQNGTIQAIAWDGIAIIDGKQCLRLPSMPLYSVWELAGEKRGETLSFVKDLVRLLMQMDESFIALESGTIPLWRIYGIEGGGVMLLPPPLSSAIEACLDEDARNANFNAWVHYDIHKPFSLIDQMAQLLYMGATGTIPLASEDAREDHCNILPLRMMGTNLEPSLVDLIDDILHAKLTAQRDMTGNQKPQEALTLLLDKLEGASWPKECVSNPDGNVTSFLERQHKKASRRRFWRRRGWLIITGFLIGFSLSYFIAGRVKDALTPPYTYGMSDEEIIQEYYCGQSELDVQKLEASLAPHVKSPAQLEVMNLYVSRQTRKAYENIDSVIDVNKWMADGKPAIGSSQGVYGVTDVSIKKSGEDSYEVTSTIYTPFAYDDEDEEKPEDENHTIAFVYQQTQTFTFTTNKRGWRLIGGVANVEYHKVGVIEIETKPDKPSQAVQAVNAAYSLATPTN